MIEIVATYVYYSSMVHKKVLVGEFKDLAKAIETYKEFRRNAEDLGYTVIVEDFVDQYVILKQEATKNELWVDFSGLDEMKVSDWA